MNDDPFLVTILAIFCFGGAQFFGVLIMMWLKTLMRNRRIRQYNRSIADNAVRYWIEHP
jgi:hypothetical protein